MGSNLEMTDKEIVQELLRQMPEGVSLQDVVQKFGLAAQSKGIVLRTEASAELPFVCADIALLERALSNLIDDFGAARVDRCICNITKL